MPVTFAHLHFASDLRIIQRRHRMAAASPGVKVPKWLIICIIRLETEMHTQIRDTRSLEERSFRWEIFSVLRTCMLVILP